LIVECIDICKSFVHGTRTDQILFDVNFSLDAGEYCAILGPSGSGKSTLMNIIGCLDKPTSGTLILDGEDVSTRNENQLADIRLQKIGFVFQNYQLLAYQSALENVALPLTYAGIGRKQREEMAAEALRKVGLEHRMKNRPSEMSGGEKQRTAIARAMINHPKILLADEPTGALDSRSGNQVMELFEALNEEGVTVLMITHDLNIAKRAKRRVRIYDGILSQEVEE
jgi:putative ABC transport system ATP-binding protein